MPGRFFDTRILLYLASADRTKAERSERRVGEGGIVNVRVLNEIANVARRRMRLGWAETHALLSAIRALLPVRPLTVETHETALRLAERYRPSFYDALIAAAALHANCDTLWSEDMQDGTVIDGRLRIKSRFRSGDGSRAIA